MSRLGTWVPTGVEERLDRMESLAAIQQLPPRYGLCLDSRDMDAMVELFVPDVRVGRDQTGREALKRWFTVTMSKMGASVHFVGNHIIDFDAADHAHGAGVEGNRGALTTHQLPDAFPSWGAFWERVAREA